MNAKQYIKMWLVCRSTCVRFNKHLSFSLQNSGGTENLKQQSTVGDQRNCFEIFFNPFLLLLPNLNKGFEMPDQIILLVSSELCDFRTIHKNLFQKLTG